MQLNEVMTLSVEFIEPNATLQNAAKLMRELNVGSLPICEGKQLIGMVTDRDITIRATAEGLDPRRTKVKKAMTPEVLYCFEDQDIEQAVHIMNDHQIRRLPVVDRDKTLVGIVSLGDLVQRTGEDLAGHALQGISAAPKF